VVGHYARCGRDVEGRWGWPADGAHLVQARVGRLATWDVEGWSLGAVWMRTPLGFHVDHPIGRVGLAKPADGLVGRVEGWALGAVWMRTPLGYHVDHPIGRVGLAKQADFMVGRVERWLLGTVWMRTPLGFHVDHPLGRVGLAKQADFMVGRVERCYAGCLVQSGCAHRLDFTSTIPSVAWAWQNLPTVW
jgi:hypothetical protein